MCRPAPEPGIEFRAVHLGVRTAHPREPEGTFLK
jgi:hypothetical protein